MSQTESSDGRIDYIELPAADFDAVEAFYSTVFGWKFVDWGEEYRSFNDGRLDGGFYKSDSCSRAATGSALVIFKSHDLEASLAAVTSAGGEIIQPIFSFPGGRRFHFADPAGNELAIWSPE